MSVILEFDLKNYYPTLSSTGVRVRLFGLWEILLETLQHLGIFPSVMEL